MNEWTWEGNENDKTGYAVIGHVRIKMESFKDFHTIMTWVDYAVSEKTHYFAEKLRQLAGEMENSDDH